MKTIYLASGNAHKLHELQTALDLAGLPVTVSGPDAIGGMPEVEETGRRANGQMLLGCAVVPHRHRPTREVDELCVELPMELGQRRLPEPAHAEAPVSASS